MDDQEQKENQIEAIEEMIKQSEDNISAAKNLLFQLKGQGAAVDDDILKELIDNEAPEDDNNEAERVVQGYYTCEGMVGNDGKKYTVPANYASKSKLIEGDQLKLTITNDGKFLYKQVKPAPRERMMGLLVKNGADNEFEVKVDDKFYKVLMASITYFKGQEGDEVVIMAPKNEGAKWAAIETVIKN